MLVQCLERRTHLRLELAPRRHRDQLVEPNPIGSSPMRVISYVVAMERLDCGGPSDSDMPAWFLRDLGVA